jgi:recombination protein RecA
LRDDKDNPLGIKGKIKNTKNKVTTPFQECDFELYFNKGLTRYYALEAVVLEAGLLEKNGAWYTEKATGNKFQGEDKLMSYIQSSQAVKDFLENN